MRPHNTPSMDMWNFLLAGLSTTTPDRTSLSILGKGGVRDGSWARKLKPRGTRKLSSPAFKRWVLYAGQRANRWLSHSCTASCGCLRMTPCHRRKPVLESLELSLPPSLYKCSLRQAWPHFMDGQSHWGATHKDIPCPVSANTLTLAAALGP